MELPSKKLPPYRSSLAGTLLAAREAVMMPIRPMLAGAGVTEQQWRVLRVLDDLGPTDVTNLADAALLFAPSLSRILKDLVERGLIQREVNPKDGRGAIVSLTAKGGDLVRETSSHTIQHLEAYSRKFGDVRLKKLISELRDFISAIET